MRSKAGSRQTIILNTYRLGRFISILAVAGMCDHPLGLHQVNQSVRLWPFCISGCGPRMLARTVGVRNAGGISQGNLPMATCLPIVEFRGRRS